MKSERVFPSTPTARSMRERCSGRARRLIAASACRKYHNWHYFTIPTAHSYKTIQSAPAPMRRHTPKPPRPRRFANAPQTNAKQPPDTHPHLNAPQQTARAERLCATKPLSGKRYPAHNRFRHPSPPVFRSLHNANYENLPAGKGGWGRSVPHGAVSVDDMLHALVEWCKCWVALRRLHPDAKRDTVRA